MKNMRTADSRFQSYVGSLAGTAIRIPVKNGTVRPLSTKFGGNNTQTFQGNILRHIDCECTFKNLAE